jgi:hypothetical protein
MYRSFDELNHHSAAARACWYHTTSFSPNTTTGDDWKFRVLLEYCTVPVCCQSKVIFTEPAVKKFTNSVILMVYCVLHLCTFFAQSKNVANRVLNVVVTF